jgi:hypothetical protein
VAAETAAADAALGLLPTVGGGMARLLACVAAGDAVHARLLAAARGQPEPPVPTRAAADGGQVRVVGLTDAAAAALSAAVEGEQAAVYGYGVAASRLDGGARETANRALAAHGEARQRVAGVLAAAGREVPAAAPSYELPGPAGTPQEAVALALLIEERVAALHAEAVASTEGEARLQAADLLTGSAVRAAAWRGAPGPLPGLA